MNLKKISGALDILAGSLFLASAVLSSQLMYYALSVLFFVLGISNIISKDD